MVIRLSHGLCLGYHWPLLINVQEKLELSVLRWLKLKHFVPINLSATCALLLADLITNKMHASLAFILLKKTTFFKKIKP